MAKCKVDGCERDEWNAGFCQPDYHRQWKAARRAKQLAAMEPKACKRCGTQIAVERTRAEFCTRECKEQQRKADGRFQIAVSKSYFKRRYGLAPEQVEEMARKGCGICGTTDWPGKHNSPRVDHDHATGKVRGVLCDDCNFGLGKFHDDPARLAAAITYLRLYRGGDS